MGNLTDLHLSDNQLMSLVPGTLDGLWSLTSLDLSYNRLTLAPGEIRQWGDSMGNLTDLDL
eukprot:6909303-Pyramimonas_sp.AAC.1